MKTVTHQVQAEIHNPDRRNSRSTILPVGTSGPAWHGVEAFRVPGSLRFELRHNGATATVDFLPVLEALANELREEVHLA